MKCKICSAEAFDHQEYCPICRKFFRDDVDNMSDVSISAPVQDLSEGQIDIILEFADEGVESAADVLKKELSDSTPDELPIEDIDIDDLIPDESPSNSISVTASLLLFKILAKLGILNKPVNFVYRSCRLGYRWLKSKFNEIKPWQIAIAIFIIGLVVMNPKETKNLLTHAYHKISNRKLYRPETEGYVPISILLKQNKVFINKSPKINLTLYEAGLKENDEIVTIDGANVSSLGAREVLALFGGRFDSYVSLQIYRDKSDTLDFKIRRMRNPLYKAE